MKLKKLLCKLFGHKPTSKAAEYQLTEYSGVYLHQCFIKGYCKRCKTKMEGKYNKTKPDGDYYWEWNIQNNF